MLKPVLSLLLATAAWAQSTVYTFDDSETSQQFASIAWTPSNVLNGATAGCQNNASQTSCQGLWWTEQDNGDYDNTIHTAFGPSVSLNFSFIGDSVTAYFLEYNVGADATYSLDGASSVGFSTRSSSSSWTYQAPLISLKNLQPVQHSLVITYNDASYGPPANRSWLVIDYFTYTVPQSLVDGSSSPTSTSSTPSNSSTSSAKSHSNIGAAVGGGVVGGVAVLFAFFAGCFFYRRRRAQSNADAEEKFDPNTDHLIARPFIIDDVNTIPIVGSYSPQTEYANGNVNTVVAGNPRHSNLQPRTPGSAAGSSTPGDTGYYGSSPQVRPPTTSPPTSPQVSSMPAAGPSSATAVSYLERDAPPAYEQPRAPLRLSPNRKG